MTEQSEQIWLSPRRYAATTNLPQSTVYDYVRKGIIPAVREGGRLWIRSSETSNAFDLPEGVPPLKYRDGFGAPLRGGAGCPRSEMAWGSAAANVERAVAVRRYPTGTVAPGAGVLLGKQDGGAIVHRGLY